MTRVQLREVRPADHAALKRLLRLIWGDDPTAPWYFRLGGKAAAVVAEKGGEAVGFGSLWANRFHPNACYFGVHVHPAHRGIGIGRALLERVTAMNQQNLPLQTSIWESGRSGARFLLQNGFREIRRTFEPILPVDEVESAGYAVFEHRCREAGYEFRSLAELAREDGRNRQVAALCAELYQATHQANPPAAFTLQEWEEIIFGDPLLEAGCQVAVKDGHYVAISLLHPGDEEGVAELGWRGACEAHQARGRDLVLALTLRQVAFARASGIVRLTGEFDTTDPGALIQLEHLPFRPAPAWITYRRN